MKFAQNFEKAFRWLLPTPLSIAVILTGITLVLAWLFTKPAAQSGSEYLLDIAGYWQQGLWNTGLLAFTVQMMLILVLGHCLALTPIVTKGIEALVFRFTNVRIATAGIAFLTILVAFFNWGLGLVVGAILAKTTADKFKAQGVAFNYGLLGAAGYSGLMVWHGGLSGSAPLKAVEPQHIQSMLPQNASLLPDFLPLGETLFSTMNLTVSLVCLLAIPAFLYWLASKAPTRLYAQKTMENSSEPLLAKQKTQGAERLDNSLLFGRVVGAIILTGTLVVMFQNAQAGESAISLNLINTLLLSLCFLLHKNVAGFLAALDEAIGGVSGILIQFPLYFGILGIMQHSGLVELISQAFTAVSTSETLPLLTFASAGLVNIFVPSGGGQWSIQAPILLSACLETGAPIAKTVMGMCYGDQLTNMLQPFWALPLLGITKLNAREIIPYSSLLFLVGLLLFATALVLF